MGLIGMVGRKGFMNGCLAFGQYDAVIRDNVTSRDFIVGSGNIVDRDAFDPSTLKPIVIPFNTKLHLIEQPQMTFRGLMFHVIIARYSTSTYLTALKVGTVDCLIAPVPLSMFDMHITQGLMTLQLPTCDIGQRISLAIENMGGRETSFVCWLEGDYIPK